MPRNNSHHARGFGIATVTYTYEFDKFEVTRHTVEEHDKKEVTQKIQKRPHAEVHKSIYYAKCERGETGDEDLKRWYREVVKDEAEEKYRHEIASRNESSAARLSHWEDRQAAGEIAANAIPPPLKIYKDFDGMKLGRTLVCHREEPDKDRGKRIRWR